MNVFRLRASLLSLALSIVWRSNASAAAVEIVPDLSIAITAENPISSPLTGIQGAYTVADPLYLRALGKTVPPLESLHYAKRLALFAKIETGDAGLGMVASPDIRPHSLRAARMAGAVALAMGLQPHEARDIEDGAMLHDIGKTDPEIHPLTVKAGPLSPAEKEFMNLHTLRGAQILAQADLDAGFKRVAVNIALHHHERVDGRGYHGLKGEEIPIEARIVHLVDMVDGWLEPRSYRRGASLSLPQVLSEMLHPSIQAGLDRRVWRAFLRVLGFGEA